MDTCDANYDIYVFSMYPYPLTPCLVRVSFTPNRPILLHLEFLLSMPPPFSVPFLAFSLGLSIRSLLEASLTHTVALDTAVDAILELYTRIEMEMKSNFISQK